MHHKDPAEEASLLAKKSAPKKSSIAGSIEQFLFGTDAATKKAKQEQAVNLSEQRSDHTNGATEGLKPTCPKSESPRARRPK